MTKLSVRVKSFKPWRQNTLFGFLDIVVPELHLQIRGATVHESHGRRWIGLPSRPLLNGDGCAERDPAGKIVYMPVVLFNDRKISDAFSVRVIEALLVVHPNAFES
jgi:hypothetical protein